MAHSGDFLQLKGLKARVRRAVRHEQTLTLVQRTIASPAAKLRHRRDAVRRLEIGPGPERIEGFETLNLVGGRQVDYIGDATKGLPFPEGTFDLIYASHVLEHVAWYDAVRVLEQWAGKLKRGGCLEVWVPDALKIAEAFVDAERNRTQAHGQDGWWRFNERHDPCLWFSGRMFSYGDGSGKKDHFNWHLAAYSERRLHEAMQEAGLHSVTTMDRSEVRGHDHGWINLGVRGVK